jgi:TPR repeat protein
VVAEYKLLVGDITYIAIPLLRIPDVVNANVRVPSSQHPMLAVRLLLACSAANDSLATLQLLAAVYHSDNDGIPQARDIAKLLSITDINKTKVIMEQLAEEGDAEAMTLHGKFLERAGRKGPAKYWYERATEECKTKFDPIYPHPMALPRERPWIALASRMQSENTPATLAKAKAALEKGAFKADDPLAYYQLASFEDTMTPKWFTYMSKAAASGHLEATYKLGRYYMSIDADPTLVMHNSSLQRALKFAVSWKPESLQSLAKEWLTVAAAGGHKPAMLELAELSKSKGMESRKCTGCVV